MNNKGYTLVEAIVVMGLMVIMVGGISIAISLMFSRDAQQVAVQIDDALSETRMYSMSKEGNYKLLIHMDTDVRGSYAQMYKDDVECEARIDFKNRDILITSDAGTGDITIEFDSANGSVKKVNGVTPSAGSIYTFTVEGQRGNKKTSTVTLVTATGRHYTDR